jgi:gas vesicle protein
MSKKSGLGKLLAGIAVGTGLGVLFAPKTGEETRKQLKEKIDELMNSAKNLDKEEVKQTIENKIALIQDELSDLDKEKVLKVAKKKAKDIQDMAEDLVNYAVEKGTPVLESAADSVRQKAIDVTKEVLTKLESKEK